MNSKIVQELDEEIIEEVRRHPIVLFWPMCKVFIGFIIVIMIFILFGASGVFSFFFFVWLIFGGIYAFYHYYIWRKDAYILSDSKVTIREQKGFFSKQVSEANLDEITDVTYKIKGFWPTVLNFGTVRAETASSDPLELVNVAKPHKLQKIILDLRGRYIRDSNKEVTARELVEAIEKNKNSQ